ncbi:hypothetical protein FB45DRAFT_909603 [Roridomyces roridus]|uniref:F-box domain-containing protein n=1 Tax=Roridomyces roridus TaxID=1738132 RepID=A0AAD7FS60_9AGAR|nr:hypothetical protein FB45DRAFT_909603 [Roridomyces roridus]
MSYYNFDRPDLSGFPPLGVTIMESPFSEILWTNHCPTDDEAPTIQSLLTEASLRLKEVNDEIQEMWRAYHKLLMKHYNLQCYIDSHTALLSPIRRMPQEILQEIFIACLPTRRDCVMSAEEAPILLGRVCRAWRTLTLNTPRLWASLHIVDHGIRPKSDSDNDEFSDYTEPVENPRSSLVADVAQTWLERSGQCPLSISLQCDSGAEPTPSLLQLLLSLAHRWQHIRFVVQNGFLQQMMELTAGDVPQLQSIVLQQHRQWFEPGQAPPSWHSMRALRGPNVTDVTVRGSHIAFSKLGVEWSQLTALSNLRIDGVKNDSNHRLSMEEALTALSRCPQLRTLALELDDLGAANSEGYLVEHLLLESLSLSGSVKTCGSLLDLLAVPQIKVLSLDLRVRFFADSSMPSEHSHVQTLVRFVSTLHSLESLTINTYQFSSSAVCEILRSVTPDLQYLHIQSFVLGGDVFTAMTPTTELPSLLPLLRDFQLDGDAQVSDETLQQFIIARASTLKRVKVNFMRKMKVDLRAELYHLTSDGLDLSVTYRPPSFETFSPWEGLPDAPWLSRVAY